MAASSKASSSSQVHNFEPQARFLLEKIRFVKNLTSVAVALHSSSSGVEGDLVSAVFPVASELFAADIHCASALVVGNALGASLISLANP